MAERDIQDRIAQAARAVGWGAFWTPRSEHSPEGEADLRLLWESSAPCPYPARYLQIELKVADANGRYRHRTDAQRQYAAWAALAGLVVLEVRWPVDRALVEAALGVTLDEEPVTRSDPSPARAREVVRRPETVDPDTWAAAVAMGPRAVAGLVADEARRMIPHGGE